MSTRKVTKTWITDGVGELNLTGKTTGDIRKLISQWLNDDNGMTGSAADLLRGIRKFLRGRIIELKPGQHVEDVYILLPRERDTIIAALRLWQRANDEGSRRFFANNFDYPLLDDIATNGGDYEALDGHEIDILIEDKINK